MSTKTIRVKLTMHEQRKVDRNIKSRKTTKIARLIRLPSRQCSSAKNASSTQCRKKSIFPLFPICSIRLAAFRKCDHPNAQDMHARIINLIAGISNKIKFLILVTIILIKTKYIVILEIKNTVSASKCSRKRFMSLLYKNVI